MFYALQFKTGDKYKTVCVQLDSVDDILQTCSRNGFQNCEYRIIKGNSMEEVMDKITEAK